MKSFRRFVRHSTLGVLISLVLVFSLFVYWGIEALVRQSVDNRLLALAVTLGQVFEKRPDFIPQFDDDLLTPTEAGLGGQAQRELLETAHSVHIVAPDGRVLWQGAMAASRPEMTPAALERVRSGETMYDTVLSADGARVRRVSIPIFRHGDVGSILQAEASLMFYDKTLSGVLLVLLVVAGATIIMAWAVSGWLASQLLSPINALRATAGAISEAKHAERLGLNTPYKEFQQLASAFNAMLARTAESQRRFVDYAAHEMQTPLTVLQANLEVTLHKARTIDEYREALIANLEQVERLITLARELLSLSRLSGDRSPVRLAPLDLEPLLKELIGELTVLAEDRQIRLSLQAQPTPLVLGDPQWLKQLLINLLDNAIRYTPPGGEVTVRLGVDGDRVTVAVQDTGPGIEPQHLPHLFERFYRTDFARARDSGGTGLGLPIVKGIADAHGGRVTVDSQVGKGSIFTLILPAHKHPSHSTP